ncbi:MAG: hypothetical protein H6586_09190 [Flavobacteriales bacterium]|nr:hypothetical protein [Leptospiraceae bacterium]MCB9336312.1 hypothetical protein [Flavobacteriales bacterium]
MLAERLILETDIDGYLKQLPRLPANKKLEVIFLIIEDSEENASPHRKPHSSIKGKIKIFGDIFSSVSTIDWNLPK